METPNSRANHCTQEGPASLWEVESMETPELIEVWWKEFFDPLPSGKWNQWKQ